MNASKLWLPLRGRARGGGMSACLWEMCVLVCVLQMNQDAFDYLYRHLFTVTAGVAFTVAPAVTVTVTITVTVQLCNCATVTARGSLCPGLAWQYVNKPAAKTFRSFMGSFENSQFACCSCFLLCFLLRQLFLLFFTIIRIFFAFVSLFCSCLCLAPSGLGRWNCF